MAEDDSPHIGQTDARTLEISRSMETLKHAKELVGITHIEPDPIIAHEENVLAVGLDAAEAPLKNAALVGAVFKQGEGFLFLAEGKMNNRQREGRNVTLPRPLG